MKSTDLKETSFSISPRAPRFGIAIARYLYFELADYLPDSKSREAFIYERLMREIGEYDWISLPDGTTFTKTFEPKKNDETTK